MNTKSFFANTYDVCHDSIELTYSSNPSLAIIISNHWETNKGLKLNWLMKCYRNNSQ